MVWKRDRLKAENDRLKQEIALLNEEIRIKDARILKLDPHRRPHYPPTLRMAILELRTARGWSQQKSADVFQLTLVSIAEWMKRAARAIKSSIDAATPVHIWSGVTQ